MSERKRLVLIDGHALAFRAFHAMANANLRTSSGEPTYAVYGFLQILLTMLQEQHPDYVAVAFDVGRTFRDDLYTEYKAGRAETPAEFHQQLARIKEALQTLNIPIYTREGYEADDVIGTLARRATDKGLDTIILTGDTDTLQLVDDHVNVLLANPYGSRTTTTLYDEPKVCERYDGLSPAQLTDLRGLLGDKSDNIPKVQGIGDKTAIPLLKQFGTVENLYDNLQLVPDKHRKKLDGHREQVIFNKELSRIVCDVSIDLDIEAARLNDYDRAAAINLFQDLEFGSTLVKKLPETLAQPAAPESAEHQGQAGISVQLDMFGPPADNDSATSQPEQVVIPSTPGDYHSITSEVALRELLHELEQAPGFAFDLESTGLNSLTSEVVGIALAVRPGHGWYIPVGHQQGPQLARDTVFAALKPFFGDPQRAKYAHNARYDIELLQQAGVDVRGLAFDTLLAARLLNKRIALKDLAYAELRLSEPMTEISELIGSGKKQITFDRVPIEQATPYAAADADMTLRLTAVLQQELEQPDLASTRLICTDLEMPLVPVVVAMETAGIGIDVAYMHELGERLGQRIEAIEQQIFELAGETFNVNSGAQLSTVLFETLKLPTTGLGKRTSTGRYSLTADVLEKWALALEEQGEDHQIVHLILQYRQLAKLKSTYVDALPELVNPNTGRIHTSFNQIGAATGRMSSTSPNLQNIPVRTEEGNAIRRAFVAAPGHIFVSADYSQIELRVLAHMTQDTNLLQVFRDRQDIHAATAAQLFGIPPAEVDKNQRRIAKTVVFGVIYGISSFGLAQRTDLERGEAQLLIDALFERFPGIAAYIDQTLEKGRTDGFVESLFGRRRAMPELLGKGARRQAAEREAINAPIQATAADIMKLAMIQVADQLAQRQLQTRLLLQVHDELIFEAPHDEADEVRQIVREVMENVMQSDHTMVRRVMQSSQPFTVPLNVNIAQGTNWEEMEEVA